jgi:hypothetical protein
MMNENFFRMVIPRTSRSRDTSSQRNDWRDIGGDEFVHLFDEFPSVEDKFVGKKNKNRTNPT